MKTVAETFHISRSNLHERVKEARRGRGRYLKADDAWLLPMIRTLTDNKPAYGYRRICALINRLLISENKPRINHKRIYRLMQQNNLLLTRHTGRGRRATHDGKVVTLRSNLRWCSDGLEFPCWNGEVVRVAFILDTCDREIIAWIATTSGISGEMIRDLLVHSIERRFGAVTRAPHPIEFLSDNGSCYTAAETIHFAHALGLIPCFTPVKSPESNGMSEAFVKGFKRDYVFVNERRDAASVLKQLELWFEDYNEVHPHRGLRMKSPREFIRSQTATQSVR